MAVAEDKAHRIDYWTRLFKARTWEALKMIAEKDEKLSQKIDTLKKLLETNNIVYNK